MDRRIDPKLHTTGDEGIHDWAAAWGDRREVETECTNDERAERETSSDSHLPPTV